MKKMNNKGFSLVELIIVIAIMAILIAVLAPQYLRYVEKSRLQSDNSAVGEVANACKVAAANDAVNSAIGTGTTVALPAYGTTNSVTCAVTELESEINSVCGEMTFKSNTYKNSGVPVISVSVAGDGTVVVTATGYVTEVGQAANSITF